MSKSQVPGSEGVVCERQTKRLQGTIISKTNNPGLQPCQIHMAIVKANVGGVGIQGQSWKGYRRATGRTSLKPQPKAVIYKALK